MKHYRLIKLLFGTLLFMGLSCNSRNSINYDLPNDSLVNVVIKRLIDLDSTILRTNLSLRLCPYTLDYSLDIKRDSATPPPPPNLSLINPISPKIIYEFFKTKIDSTIRLSDTSFFFSEIANSKDRFLDTLMFKNFNLVKVDYSRHKDYFRLDSLLVFYYPIFASDKKTVYINYHYKGYGVGSVLRFRNNQWIMTSQFDTWVRCK